MLDFSKDGGIFNVDEKIILNRMGAGVSKSEFLAQVGFSDAATNDADCKALMHDVLAKVDGLTDAEWEDLQMYLPFDVPFFDGDMLPEESDNLQEA